MTDQSGETRHPTYHPDARCPKCRGKDVGTSYQDSSHGYSCMRHRAPRDYDATDSFACSGCGDEHFHRTCRTCHHEWREEMPPPCEHRFPPPNGQGFHPNQCLDCGHWTAADSGGTSQPSISTRSV